MVAMDTSPQQLTQLYLYTFNQSRFWAFKQMGIGPVKLKGTQGLLFYKFLGTGGGNGFSLRPDFSTYALLLVWESEAAAMSFVNTSLYKAYLKKAEHIRCLSLRSFQSHGQWSGQNPFRQTKGKAKSDEKIAIITRATLRWRRLFSFWRYVPQAARAIEMAKGVLYFKGIGEWPFIQQATISIWNTLDDLLLFAYRDTPHASIVKKTRQKKWYAEDLFARFTIQNDVVIKS